MIVRFKIGARIQIVLTRLNFLPPLLTWLFSISLDGRCDVLRESYLHQHHDKHISTLLGNKEYKDVLGNVRRCEVYRRTAD